MIFGKKKKYEELKIKYEVLERKKINIRTMDWYKNNGFVSHDVSDIIENMVQNFVIEVQQFRILIEMFSIMPVEVEYEKLEMMSKIFSEKFQDFIASGMKSNADKILMCKILLGKQYKYYENNILEINSEEEKAEDLYVIWYWVEKIVKIAENYGYIQYGKEILDNFEKELKKNNIVITMIIKEKISFYKESLEQLEKAELKKEKERLEEELRELKRQLLKNK